MKSCLRCEKLFEVGEDDRFFYEKVCVPEPKLCPGCRAQRRLAWRNERKLYVSKSSLSGERLVSVISPDKPLKVYSVEEWWSDEYDPLSYGREFDFSRSFFEQFKELLEEVPHMNMIGSNNENAPYCHLVANCRNCYMIVESSNNEDCYHGYWLQKCVGCCDVSYSHDCQYCYEVDNCYGCYNLKWARNCNNCADSYFLKDCIGVRNSFGCINLRQKQYCIFNEQKTKEEYEEFMAKIDFESHEMIEKLKRQFEAVALKLPNKYAQIVNSEDCTGNYIMNSRDCEFCFHAHDAEKCKYGEHVWRNSKNNMDVSTVGRDAEWIYESINTGIGSNNVQFAVQNWSCSDMQYCYGSFNSSNSFGCVGLKRQEYCILNKQYGREEYFVLREKIVAHMKKGGEYGEFFPAELSPFGYNETVAGEQFELSREEALRAGFRWSDYLPDKPDVKKVIAAGRLPDKNSEIPDEVLDWAIECEVSGKLFRLTGEELKFYRSNKVALPRKHPEVRHAERMKKRNENKLWSRACAKCSKEVLSAYAPGCEEVVYCGECFLESVY